MASMSNQFWYFVLLNIAIKSIDWFTRYPKETTKVWNLVYLFTPTSWMWTFISIFSIVFVMSSFTVVYKKLEIGTMTEEIILFPYR